MALHLREPSFEKLMLPLLSGRRKVAIKVMAIFENDMMAIVGEAA